MTRDQADWTLKGIENAGWAAASEAGAWAPAVRAASPGPAPELGGFPAAACHAGLPLPPWPGVRPARADFGERGRRRDSLKKDAPPRLVSLPPRKPVCPRMGRRGDGFSDPIL